MRRTVITEDIISRALNESIDEFMLEEGAWDGLKNWFNKLGNTKFMRGLNNAVNMYMDYKTNGQRNQKYGAYVNGNTKYGELFYLDKWFKYYKQQLNNIIYQANNPSQRDEYETWERDKNNPNKEYKRINRYDYVGVNGALKYAQKYCTFQNFNDYVRGISPDRMSISYINTYIFNYITKQAQNNNLKAVLNNLDIVTFYSSKQGQMYLKMDRSKQQNARKDAKQRLSTKSKQQNQQPTPEANGSFNYNPNTIDYGIGKYSTWKPSKDANGMNILVNPQNPTQAVFY